MTLFDNIKKYSKVRGLSLQEVAKKAGFITNRDIHQKHGIQAF